MTLRIELKPQLTRFPDLPVKVLRAKAWVGAVFGSILAALALAGLVMAVLGRLEALIGFVVLGLPGGLMLFLSAKRLRRLRGRAGAERMRIVPPYAFTISPETLEFPGTLDQAPESWPRAGTTARVVRWLGQDALRLDHPGRRRRIYLGKALMESPQRIVELLQGW